MQPAPFQARIRRALARVALGGLAGLCLAATAGPRIGAQITAQTTSTQAGLMRLAFEAGQPPGYRSQPYALDTGAAADQSENATGRAFKEIIRVEGAQWLRLTFAEATLAPGSYIQITSLKDGGTQRLDAGALALWGNTSAFFNGDAVTFELVAPPGDTETRVRMERLWYGDPALIAALAMSGLTPPGTNAPVSLCGPDNRVASTESRVGRLWGHVNGSCTAWLISNGAVLTAGHCVDLDPDGSGSQLPDGTLDLSGVMEFNVPLSQANGSVNMAAPEDQFPIDFTSFTWRFDGEGQGLGKDWAVFRINPNTTTGERAHVGRGFFRVTNGNPAVNATMRVTGFGSDTGTANFTNQTDTGPYVGENSSGANIWHRYQVDTTGGNSGSPIIWTLNGYTVGIHTNAGCNSDGTGANNGTSFEVDALETAMQNFPGAPTRYVDSVAPYPTGGESGFIFNPFNTVGEGVTAVPAGGRVSIVTGTYNEGAQTINKALTLEAPVGDVVIR